MRQYYDTLGVNENTSFEEIKKAYKKLAMKNHPDQWGSEFIFKQINTAYQEIKQNHWNWKYTSNNTTQEQENTYTKKEEKKYTSTTKKRYSHEIEYILQRKVSHFFKFIFIIFLFFGILEEFNHPMIRDFIIVSFGLFLFIFLYYNISFSKTVKFDISLWLLSYIMVIIPFVWLLYIEESLWLSTFTLTWLFTIGLFIKLLHKPLKEWFFKKTKWVIYLLFFLQVITYLNI